jgi:hypothetical protein
VVHLIPPQFDQFRSAGHAGRPPGSRRRRGADCLAERPGSPQDSSAPRPHWVALDRASESQSPWRSPGGNLLFADIPADMTEEELTISRSTPSPQFGV